ncbi:MAG: hypothetical protein H6979_06785 [Chromatiales bacterium]|nr:hypothetical protein [Chromatiales bacterium]
MKIYFSDFFDVDPVVLDQYGAFNISLINDLPVFIDPFLLFNSEKAEYRSLHDEIIGYIRFLRDISNSGYVNNGLLSSWYRFPEVKQNWLGYSKVGNRGSGLGAHFAAALNENLNSLFRDFGTERVTRGSHLEKLCLIKDNVGRDNISDFTTNLVKGFLCRYTQQFAQTHIDPDRLRRVPVRHVSFNYETRSWMTENFALPYIDGDFVLLTPKEILTKDDAWINKHDLIGNFRDIASSIPNEELRAQINDYFLRMLPRDANKKEEGEAIIATIRQYPTLIDYFIRYKEEHGEEAQTLSEERVFETEQIFIEQVGRFSQQLAALTQFYERPDKSYQNAYDRVMFLKQVIENNDGYRVFYVNGKPVKREADLQIMFKLTWYASDFAADSEVNNGRGPVDFKISRGSRDSTVVEFKLASNSKLKRNLENQVEIYQAANPRSRGIKVIMCFSEGEILKVSRILNDLRLTGDPNIVVIDADANNKVSASNVH